MAASAIRINKQSLDIASGVNVGNGDLDVGAGDEIEDLMPPTHAGDD